MSRRYKRKQKWVPKRPKSNSNEAKHQDAAQNNHDQRNVFHRNSNQHHNHHQQQPQHGQHLHTRNKKMKINYDRQIFICPNSKSYNMNHDKINKDNNYNDEKMQDCKSSSEIDSEFDLIKIL